MANNLAEMWIAPICLHRKKDKSTIKYLIIIWPFPKSNTKERVHRVTCLKASAIENMHQNHLGGLLYNRFLGLILDLLNQKSWEWLLHSLKYENYRNSELPATRTHKKLSPQVLLLGTVIMQGETGGKLNFNSLFLKKQFLIL